jgi:endonuclease/exonuclease/phosphatase family metal-dependent hydrolase
MSFIKKSLRLVNLVLVLVTLLAYLSPMVNPAKVWHLTFLGLAYPVLLMGNIAFVIFWALRKNRYFLFSLVCIVVGLGYFTSFFGFHFFKSAQKKEGEISVMTFNVAGFRNLRSDDGLKKAEILANLEKLAQKYGQPEILCAQESTQNQVTDLLRKAFGYTHHFKFKGTTIFSKFPFLKEDVVAFESVGNSAIWADLKTPDGIVRVYCIHLQSNSLSYTANKIATKGDLREKQTWRDIRFVMKQYKRAVTIRAEQANAVKNHMAKSPYPVILCGDFNDPPVSYVYRLLSEDLQDGFREKGAGISSTFNGKLPALRIDHILADEKFKIRDYRIPDVELSDHFPVLVRIAQRVRE